MTTPTDFCLSGLYYFIITFFDRLLPEESEKGNLLFSKSGFPSAYINNCFSYAF